MIATIYGKPSSGKTTILTNLACILSEKGIRVGLLSSNIMYSSLPYYYGRTRIKDDKSIGSLINKNDFGQIGNYFISAKGYKNIFIAGPSSNDHCFKYSMPTKDEAEILLKEICNIYDIMFIEATEDINNPLDILSIMKADYLMNVLCPSVQGISYAISYSQIIKGIKPKSTSIRIANNVRNNMDIKLAEETLGFKFDYILPYSNIVQEADDTGKPVIYNFGGLQYKAFAGGIKAISKDIFEELDKEQWKVIKK